MASIPTSPGIHPSSTSICETLAVVSKCHNPRCSAQFRYFGDGKLFEFTADSIRESSQLYWLCEHCTLTYTLERDSDGEVHLAVKRRKEDSHPARSQNFHRAS